MTEHIPQNQEKEENAQPEENTTEQVAESQPVENVPSTEGEQTASKEETPEEINWKKFREQRKRERQQAEALAQKKERAAKEAEALKEAMAAMMAQQPKPTEDDYEPDVSEEDRIKQLVAQQIEEFKAKEAAKRKEEEQKNMPVYLRQQFPDFDKVVTQENLDYFEYHYPELSTPYNTMPDSMEKWASIYKALKRFMPNTNSDQNKNRMESNLKKPQALSSSSDHRDSQPIQGLTEQRKRENYSRMIKALKTAS